MTATTVRGDATSATASTAVATAASAIGDPVMLFEGIDTRQVYYRTIASWLALALVIRLAVWWFIPAARFASDEDSYYQVGTALLHGHQDVFWPPLTGWLIALVRLATGSDSLPVVRLSWIALDVGCTAFVFILAQRVGRSLWPQSENRAATLARIAAAGYALYLPAISHAQFVTSEIPALFLTLLMLVVVTSRELTLARYVAAGLLAGLQCLARPSLLPILVLVPAALMWARRIDVVKAAAFIAVGSLAIGAYVIRNWHYAGEATISTNSAYNLYIGNNDFYAEDLDLFHPRATREQIEFRRQQFSDQAPPFTQSPAESQRLALQWIRQHPLTFTRRALGRLARVFVPKTDVLELTGGSARVAVSAPSSLALLAAANLEWTLILFGGLIGLFALRHQRREWWLLFGGVILGALALCLIAISKPRYSFVFDPILIVCAASVWIDRDSVRATLTRADRRALAVIFAFLAWAWVAFAVFSITSRAAL